MKKHLLVSLLAVTALLTLTAADEGRKPDRTSAKAQPVMSKPEIIEAKVLKVYSAEDDGAKFKGYVFKWKEGEAVAMDFFGISDKKEGDTIKVMIHRMEIPGRGKTLRFMIADPYGAGGGGASGTRKPDANESIDLNAPEDPAAHRN